MIIIYTVSLRLSLSDYTVVSSGSVLKPMSLSIYNLFLTVYANGVNTQGYNGEARTYRRSNVIKSLHAKISIYKIIISSKCDVGVIKFLINTYYL